MKKMHFGRDTTFNENIFPIKHDGNEDKTNSCPRSGKIQVDSYDCNDKEDIIIVDQ